MSGANLKLIVFTLFVASHAQIIHATDEDKVTSTRVPCKNVSANKEQYGCVNEYDKNANIKFKCLKQLSKYNLDHKQDPKSISKIIADKKVMAIKSKDDFLVVDGKKEFAIPKEKVKKIIKDKLGDSIKNSSNIKVAFQTAEGKVNIKVSTKNVGEGFELGEISLDKSDKVENQVLIPVGESYHTNAIQKKSLENIKGEMTNRVKNFDENVNTKISLINSEFQSKISDINKSSDLSGIEKVNLKKKVREDKSKAIEKYNALKKSVKESKKITKEACSGGVILDKSVFDEDIGSGHSSSSSNALSN